MLQAEGVKFDGTKVARTSVVEVDEMAALVGAPTLVVAKGNAKLKQPRTACTAVARHSRK
eukprot:93608-Chlamydomonas_euryale.AAC.3